MNLIQSIIADLNAVLKRIETEIGTHPMQQGASAGVKAAATSLAQHPDASAAPSTIVSPGMEAPAAETVASASAASPANPAPIDNDPSVASGAATPPTAPAAS